MKRAWLIHLFVVTAAVGAHAAPAQSYTLLDLIDQKIPIQLSSAAPPAAAATDVEVTNLGAACKVTVRRDVQGSKLAAIVPGTQGIEACPPLWKVENAPTFTISFKFENTPHEVSLAPAVAGSAAADALKLKTSGQFDSRGIAANSRLFFFADPSKTAPWVTAIRIGSTGFALTPTDASLVMGRLEQGDVRYYLDNGGSLLAGTLPKSTDSSRADATGGASAKKSGGATARMKCPEARPAQVICVDMLDPGEIPKVTFVPKSGHVIKPNRDVIVRVRHLRGASVDITMAGTRGLFVPGTLNQTPADMPDNQSGGAGAAPQSIVTVQSFAPRMPGNADVTIEVDDKVVQTIELIVDQTYSGVIRLGIGFPFAGAKDAEYAVETLPGSSQPEIVSKTFGGVDLELVVGYSPYLESGGRSLTRRKSAIGFQPFIGIGVWAPEATGVEFLKSLYLGGEVELTQNFAISLNAVARRVTRLQKGFHVGSAVDGSEAPTNTGVGLGAGFVVSFSPDFLRIARPAAGAFLE